MSANHSIAATKVHPATREVMPDDPMEMHAIEVPGDTDLMLRLLVEEYARIGWGVDQIMQLSRDPNYVAFHGLAAAYGEEPLHRRVTDILSRCGVIRVKTKESEPMSEQLVQLELKSEIRGTKS